MDTIGDFLTRIRNAGAAKHEKLDIPASNVRVGIAKILLENGYIRSFKVVRDDKQGVMRVYLKYNEKGKPMISAIDRVSRPGRRVYVKSHAYSGSSRWLWNFDFQHQPRRGRWRHRQEREPRWRTAV